MPETIPDLLDEAILLEQAQRGDALYVERLRPLLEPQENGRVVAVHLDSADYAVARNDAEATRALRIRRPEGLVFTRIIGSAEEDAIAYRMLADTELTEADGAAIRTGVQRGLEDFQNGRFSRFEDYAASAKVRFGLANNSQK